MTKALIRTWTWLRDNLVPGAGRTDGAKGDLPSAAFVYLDPETVGLLNRFGIDLVLDVGANRGQFAQELFRAGYQGRVVSFEPLSDAHADLVLASRGNPRWTVAERCAIGDRAATVTLHVAGNSESSSLLPMLGAHEEAAPGSRYIGSEEVPLRRLDEVAAEYVDTAIAPFLKLDVQGSEDAALDGVGGILPRLVGIQTELELAPLYQGGGSLGGMLARLQGLGFSLWRLRPGFTDRLSGRMLQADGVFFRDEREAFQ